MDVPKQLFEWPDHLVFVFMLLVCIGIGVYFGFFHTSKNVSDYLVGNRTMSVWPVAISLVTSYISGISFLGIPTEMYIYGTQYLYHILDGFVMGFIGKEVFLAVFVEMQCTSSYEYLEKRFDSSLRRFGSVMFLIGTGLWLPIVIYVPALALNHATGLNVHIITIIVCTICIFYTCVGGIRAVVWTDFMQAFMMVGSVLLVIIKGTIDVGGLGTVFQRNFDSGRIEAPDMEINLTKRLNFINIMVGGSIGAISYGIINQVMMQRYVSLPTLKDATKCLWIFLILKSIFYLTCAYAGILIYATYYNCDPISTKVVQAKDQLLPLLVIDTLGGIPGAAGLFLSGVFSASLSSLSSGLNSLAAVILEDFYKPFFVKVSQKEANIVVKATILIVGVMTVGLAFVVEKLGPVLQLSASLGAVSSGPILGVFILGLLLPWVNAKGAYYGGLGGLAFMMWILFGAQLAIADGSISYPTKPVSTEGCTFNFTTPEPPTISLATDESEVFYLYRISFMLYTLLGAIVTMILGLIISFATGFNKVEDVNPLCLSPIIRKYVLPKKMKESCASGYKETNITDEVPVEIINLLDKANTISEKA